MPGLLSSSEVDQLVEITERAIAAHDAWASGAPAADTAPWFVPFEPLPGYQLGYGRKFVRDAGGVWVVDSPRGMHELTRIFARAGLPETIGAHLGEHPLVSVKKWTLRRVPVDTSTDWHQDGAFLGAGIRTVNVWISLSHCGVDAPSLDLVPRRLEGLVETGTDGAYFDWSVGHGAAERMAGGPGILRPVFEPGDALLFDEVFLHRTGVSATMLEERYAIESWFFAPSCYPQRQIPVAL